MTNKNIFISFLLLACLLITGCTPLIGTHSPKAYENATSLKAKTLALMDKATEPYEKNSAQVEGPNGHTATLNSAYEFVANINKNNISAKQWKLLIDKDGDLYGRFITRWKERSKLNKVYIDEFKGIISDAFSEIICLEANKKEATNCSLTKGE